MTDLASPTQAATPSGADTIDTLAGLQAGSPLAAIRHARDKVALHTQRSEDALFDPALPDLSLQERLFAAWYAARLSLANDLADAYAAKLIAQELFAHPADRERFITRVREAIAGEIERGEPLSAPRVRTRTKDLSQYPPRTPDRAQERVFSFFSKT